MTAINTLEEIRNILANFSNGNESSEASARDRDSQLTKPPGALGGLEDIVFWMSKWQGRTPISLVRPRVAVFAGNHGVVQQGLSAFSKEVTEQMVGNFKNNGAAVNQLCKTYDAELKVYEMRLNSPTEDFTKSPAMSEEDCVNAIAYGMTVVEPGIDILCVGEMGIGNTTSGAAIAHALYGGNPQDWTGPGTGVVGAEFSNKVRVVGEAVEKHKDSFTKNGEIDGLEVLRHLGGFELCAIIGAVIAARMANVPVILDGYTTCAAAAVLVTFGDGNLDHCIVGHLSAEPSHIRLLDNLNKKPLVNFNMRLGEASGAVIALGIVRGAVACHNGMATFAEAGVNEKI